MNLEFVALGGAIDPLGKKPSIGGSAYAVIDRDTASILLIDCGAYPLSAEKRALQSNVAVKLLESAISVNIDELPREEKVVAGVKVRTLPTISTFFTGDDLEIDLKEMTDECLPNIDILEGMRDITIVITHAHVDHIGSLVFLKKRFPHAKVFMTKPTRDISLWSWYDSLKVIRRSGHIPLFNTLDVKTLVKDIVLVREGEVLNSGPFELTFAPAGHILGAISVLLKGNAFGLPTVFFSGDMSIVHQHSVGPAVLPSENVDVLVTESTYAGRSHESRDEVERKLARDVEATLEGGGKVLFPALSIGRPLEIYAVLKQHGITERFDVYIDGAARDIAHIYSRYGNVSPAISQHFIASNRERDAVMRSDRPLAVIAPSGMLYGGYSVEYAVRMADNPKNMIAFSSFLDSCSPGYRLMRIPQGSFTYLYDINMSLNARVVQYGLSAHLSHSDILSVIDILRPKETFAVHGDREGMDKLIEERGASVHKTYTNTFYQLT